MKDTGKSDEQLSLRLLVPKKISWRALLIFFVVIKFIYIIYLFIYLFIFGCAGSSLLRVDFL